jgi:hypothetical protein
MLVSVASDEVLGVPMWVRLADWEVVDGEVEKPVPGAVMRSMALSIHGRREPVGAQVFEGGAQSSMLLEDATFSGPSRPPVYVVTGRVEQADDVWANYGQGSTHAGARLLLQLDGWRLFAQVDGSARESDPGSLFPVRIRGCLSFVASYEWDAFGLTDIRTDWVVMEVVHLPSRDFLVRVQPT